MITLEELEKRINSAGKMTAAELDELLYSCPEWVARREADDRKRQAMAEEFHRDAAPIIKDLAKIGFSVRSPSELQLLPDPYPEAFPILLRHLDREYIPRVRESMVAALGVPYARGEPARAVLRHFRHSDNEHREVRFRMADTLEVTADRSMADELEELAAKERDEGIARMLTMAAKSARKRKPVA